MVNSPRQIFGKKFSNTDLKFLLRFFQKADGGWGGAPNIGVSFLRTFFFAPMVSKKKVAKEFCLFKDGRPMVAPTGLCGLYHVHVTLSGVPREIPLRRRYTPFLALSCKHESSTSSE